jgi:hypothetical protein
VSDPARRPRTGARKATGRPRPAAPATGPAPGASTTHKGYRWQRHPSGVLRWWDGDQKRWMIYRPGADAPPRPPGWEAARGQGGPATDRSQRAPWRSPYRIVPLVFLAAIIIVGLFALRTTPADQARAETQATAKLLHACLHQNGTSGGHPEYASKPVACSSPQASVQVVKVLPGTPGSPHCPAADASLSVPYPGVKYPHVLCTQAVSHPG